VLDPQEVGALLEAETVHDLNFVDRSNEKAAVSAREIALQGEPGLTELHMVMTTPQRQDGV
jgi:hypothetical protein